MRCTMSKLNRFVLVLVPVIFVLAGCTSATAVPTVDPTAAVESVAGV